MYIKNQKFLVLGISKSGYSASKYILQNGGICYLYEEMKSPKIDLAIKELTDIGGIKVDYEERDKILELIDVLVISPGAPINHELAIKAKKLNKRIVGELEFGYLQFIPTIVGVTGTNGKTTTVTLIDAILKESGIKTSLVGNVGVPLTKELGNINKDTVVVCEVSSFQLESVSSFCPHISCILNISPDHLERHYNMENYIYLKQRIYKNQRESEYCVLNYDDETVRNFALDIRGKIKWISIKEKVDGAYFDNGKLYYMNEYIMDENQLKLIGNHNIYDTLFAICVAKLLKVNDEHIVNALKNFKGVKHRIEFLTKKKGVSFYNDSKATNTASTMVALDTVKEPIILILGGSDKGESYDNLFKKIKTSYVKAVVITGVSRYKMAESAGRLGVKNITITEDFTSAVKIAYMMSVEGDAVLLSPACSSFDMFSSFEERGETFRNIVEEL